jgi:succinate dehydrogenase / fumarate reductase iron-sulfur subunit
MAKYTLKVRRFQPEEGEGPYWETFDVDLDPTLSVLDGLLQAKDRDDGSLAVRCSCKAAICGSCGVRVNGQPGLACHTHLDHALRSSKDGVIEIEPMGNMPVIKDLIVDMDAVHWKKIQRVTPWLITDDANMPEREHIVPRESMVDVTQSMACIQCGACVSDCLSMEVDPLFVGPAASAKSYRFVGDPRDTQQFERLKDLAEDPHGIYTCTHCFKCIDACPKGVAPMSQIMRLRRRATGDAHINDRNNGDRHESSFVTLIHDYGLLHEAELLPRSWGGNSWFGKFHPAAGKVLLQSLPVVTKAVLRGKMSIKLALLGHKLPSQDLKAVQKIYDKVENRPERLELNLYITGYDEDNNEGPGQLETVAAGTTAQAGTATDPGQPGQDPEGSTAR